MTGDVRREEVSRSYTGRPTKTQPNSVARERTDVARYTAVDSGRNHVGRLTQVYNTPSAAHVFPGAHMLAVLPRRLIPTLFVYCVFVQKPFVRNGRPRYKVTLYTHTHTHTVLTKIEK